MLNVGSAHAPPNRNCVPLNCVSEAGLPLSALVRSCGRAILVPAIPPEAGISVFAPGNGGTDCPSGYKGRAGIYQVMPISDAMKRLIIEGANAVQLADQSRDEGIWDIRTSGLSKVRAGLTSLAEVNRVTVE